MPDVLSENRDYHKKLRSDPELTAVAREVAGESVRLENTGSLLHRLLEEFSDLERVPGHCELCTP